MLTAPMKPPTDLGAVRLARVLAALEDVQRWAEGEAGAPCLLCGVRHEYVPGYCTREVDEPEEAERRIAACDGYAEAERRVGELRAALDVTRPDAAAVLAEAHGGPAEAFAAVLEHVRGLAEWARLTADDADDASGAEVEVDELRAAGRADALYDVARELRSVLEAAPRGTA